MITSLAPSEQQGARGVYNGLKAAGIEFAVSLPDATLGPVDALLQADDDVQHAMCSREDEGVAMAVGAYLGGKLPVALMEGSGVGYCGLILARAQAQRTPVLLLVGHSRVLGEQFDFHAATLLAGEGVLRGLGIPYLVMDDPSRTALIVEQAAWTMRGQKTCVGLLVPPYLLK